MLQWLLNFYKVIEFPLHLGELLCITDNQPCEELSQAMMSGLFTTPESEVNIGRF